MSENERPPAPRESWWRRLWLWLRTLPSRIKRSSLRRRARHDADDYSHPVDRARKWAVLHPFTAAVLTIGLIYIPPVAIGGYVVNCIIDYNHDYLVAARARSEASNAVDVKRQELDKLQLKIYTQSATQADYDKYRKGLRDLVELVEDQQEALKTNPLPEYPGGLCGFSVQ